MLNLDQILTSVPQVAPVPRAVLAPLNQTETPSVDQLCALITKLYQQNQGALALALGNMLTGAPFLDMSVKGRDGLATSLAYVLAGEFPNLDPRETARLCAPGINAAHEAGSKMTVDKFETKLESAQSKRQVKENMLRDISAQLTAQQPIVSNPGGSTSPQNPAPAWNETRSDLGNARRLVRLHGAGLRYCRARDCWYVWDGARWRFDDTGEAKRAAKSSAESLWDTARHQSEEWRKFAAASLNRGRIENALSLAQSEPGVPVTVDMLDADPWLLNVQNGTLDLRTGELRAPDRALLMTKSCSTPYVPGARSELWEGFVARLTDGDAELAAYLQRTLGYALFGSWQEKAFWFGYGPPDGGKSTFLGVVSDVLGDYAIAAAASTWMIQHSVGGNRGDLARLLGARLVTTLEVRPGARFDPEVMKKATGGDRITAAAKFENEIEFKPAFALWFGANDRPVIPDDDEGFWSRVRCVPFVHVIPKAEQDKALKEKLTGSSASCPTMSHCCASAASFSAAAMAVSITPVQSTAALASESSDAPPRSCRSGRLTSLPEPSPSPGRVTLGDKSRPEATFSPGFESRPPR